MKKTGGEMYLKLSKIKKMLLMIMTVALSFVFTLTPVQAEESGNNTISTDPVGSINLRINNDEWYVEGTTFRLYQVETISSDLKFTKTDAFKKADVDLTPESLTGQLQATADKWMNASGSLIKYVRKNNITDNDEKQMHNRSLQFDHLVPGLYLIQGDTSKEGNRTVTYQPVLICIPQRSDASEPWNYTILAAVKSADPTYTYPAETPTATPETSPQPGKTPVPSNKTETSPQPSGTPVSDSPKEKPDTRDTFNAWMYAGVLIVMGVVIGIVIYIRNKERKD